MVSDGVDVAVFEGWLVEFNSLFPSLVTFVLVPLDVLVHGVVDFFHEVVAWCEAFDDSISLVHSLVRDSVEPSSNQLSWAHHISFWTIIGTLKIVVWALDKTHALSNVSIVHAGIEIDTFVPESKHGSTEGVDISLVLFVSHSKVVIDIGSGHDILGEFVKGLIFIIDAVVGAS